MTAPQPPRLARAILLAWVPPSWRGQIEGDLAENFAWRCAEYGVRAARRWYWGQLWSLDVWRLRRLGGRLPGSQPSSGGRLAGVGSDLRGGIRSLRRQPVYSGAVLATLAIGIGSTAAIFAVVNSVLLRPLPYREPERLAMVFRTVPRLGFTRSTASYPDYHDWREQSQSFTDLAAYASTYLTYADDESAERWTGFRVTANLFPMLGTVAAVGRTFTTDDDRPGAAPTVLVSHAVWRSRFGADSALVGRRVVLDGTPRTVVGVLPAAFGFPSPALDFLVPLQGDVARSERDANFLVVIGRLRAGVTVERANRELTELAARIDAEAPGANQEYGVFVENRHVFVVRNARAALWMFLGAVTLVLLIAIVNVANLTLARGTARHRELAVRTALGASRSRLFRQLLTESTLLGIIGGVLGLGVAAVLLRGLVVLGPADLPRLHEIRLDGVVLLVTVGLAVGSGIAFGAIPALFGSGRSAREALGDGGRTSGLGRWGRRVQRTFVVGEIAMAMALTVAAGLLIVSFARLTSVDPGFDPDNLVAGRVAPPEPVFGPDPTPADFFAAVAAQQRFFTDLLGRVLALPGVSDAALAYGLPLSANSFSRVVEPEGLQIDGDPPVVEGNVVLGDYFRVMGIPLIRGRGFTEADDANAPDVIVVSAALAAAYWPNEDAVGKRMKVGNGADRPWIAVVGVVADVTGQATGADRPPMYYRPFTQAPWPSSMYSVVRSSVPSTELVPALRRQVASLNPQVPLTDVTTARQLLADSVATPRYRTLVLGAFGAMALGLALVGIYGVIAYFVGDRTREIGIRIALGAGRSRVVEMILRQGLALAVGGIVLGVAAAAALTGVLSGMLFGLSPLDPGVYVSAAGVVLLVVAGACYAPARRAARIDPIESVRYE